MIDWSTIWQGTVAIAIIVGLLGTAIWRTVSVRRKWLEWYRGGRR